jgi:signal peptidase I
MKKIFFTFLIILSSILFTKIFFLDIKIVKTTNKKSLIIIIKKNTKLTYNNLVLYKSPFDEKEHISRIIGIAKDTITIRNSIPFRNGKKIICKQATYQYRINCFSKKDTEKLIKKYKYITKKNILGQYFLLLNEQQANQLKNDNFLVKKIIQKKGFADKTIFPQSFRYQWNKDNFGPLEIPYKNEKINLNKNTFSLYKNTLKYFENTEITEKNDKIYYKDKVIKNYRFTKNYYFLLNDNRNNKNDSRTIGPIPKENIKGKIIKIYNQL